jgi:hypothetical protein
MTVVSPNDRGALGQPELLLSDLQGDGPASLPVPRSPTPPSGSNDNDKDASA